ncbi:MAG: M17 family metallopeptidase [Parvibaculaceae bacterium]
MIEFEKLLLPVEAGREAIGILNVEKAGLEAALASLGTEQRAWAERNGFAADAGQWLMLPGSEGRPAKVIFGMGNGGGRAEDPFLPGKLARMLPEGDYAFEGAPRQKARLWALGWLLEAYDFDRYRMAKRAPARLAAPKGVSRDEILRLAGGVRLARDLINTPASDMGPDELEDAARALGRRHRARVRAVSGPRLAKQFPLIAAVGRASPRRPRLIDLAWGDERRPKVTLVGKGVCFDTGGLDIKPSSGMLLMKKDMGGAATVLGLASMIMDARLKLRLRVLIPAVENAIAGDAFRPGDVLRSRKGLSVEIGNTDAEGRLVLADALALADEEAPELLIDMATLTGAARVALGPDLPALYTDDDGLADDIQRFGGRENDPCWRLPLWRPYHALFDSRLADLNNAGSSGFAGSITAALFLQRFVEKAKAWAHFDIFAWTPTAKPGRPMGGEAQMARALFALLDERYG